MHWLTVQIDTVHAGLETVSALLSALGIDAISVEDGEEFQEFLEENRQYWDYVDETLSAELRGRSRVTFYLPETEAGFAQLAQARIALQELREARSDCGSLLMTLKSVQESDWENNWKQYYQPIEIGERLVIVPEWEQANVWRRMAQERKQRARVPVILDPGVTFGTGEHDTTRLCLGILDRCVKGGERVLDLGCGSGILSIAALRLGAAEAVAVDIDEVCQRVTRANAALNGIHADRYHVLIGDILTDKGLLEQVRGGFGGKPDSNGGAADTRGKYDLVMANIVADVIIRLAPLIPALLAPGGRWICSGIIGHRAAEAAKRLSQNGLEIAETYQSRDWYAYSGVWKG